MPTIEIPIKTMKEFEDFCSCNDIQDVEKEFLSVFTLGFNIRKYGTTPFKDTPSKVKIPITQTSSEVTEKNNNQEIKQEEKPKKRVKVIKVKDNGNN